MKTHLIIQAALAGVAALLAACGDSTGNAATGSGSLSFTYGGARTGTYSARGEIRQNGNVFVKQPFAVGIRSQLSGQSIIGIESYQPVTSTTGNEILIGIPEISGTGSIDLGGQGCTGTFCPLALLVFNANPDREVDDSELFAVTSGTVTITSNTGRRLRGTFSGTASFPVGDSVITITNGQFDVPVRDQSSLSGSRAVVRPTRMLERHAKPE